MQRYRQAPVTGQMLADEAGAWIKWEDMRACQRMFTLDLYKQVDPDSEHFNQALFDVSQKVNATLSLPAGGMAVSDADAINAAIRFIKSWHSLKNFLGARTIAGDIVAALEAALSPEAKDAT